MGHPGANCGRICSKTWSFASKGNNGIGLRRPDHQYAAAFLGAALTGNNKIKSKGDPAVYAAAHGAWDRGVYRGIASVVKKKNLVGTVAVLTRLVLG